jgi:hypothetical protein
VATSRKNLPVPKPRDVSGRRLTLCQSNAIPTPWGGQTGSRWLGSRTNKGGDDVMVVIQKGDLGASGARVDVNRGLNRRNDLVPHLFAAALL